MDALPEVITHPARPGHKLKLVKSHPSDAAAAAITFVCDGCKLPGAGTRYTSVVVSNLVLHTDCAVAKPTRQHPLVKKCTFELRHEAPTGDDAVLCDACGGKVLGFHYHGDRKSNKGVYLDLHPCCANLPLHIRLQGEGGLAFELRETVKHRCSSCRAMDGYYSTWFYRSTCKEKKPVYLHVKCVMEKLVMAGNRSGGAGSSRDVDRRMNVIVPFVDEALRQSGREEKTVSRGGGGRSKLERILTMVASVVRIIIAVLIGDPTPILAAAANAVISNLLLQ